MNGAQPDLAQEQSLLRARAHGWVLILDFGSQTTQLIARRVRELKLYCEVHPATLSAAAIRAMGPSAIILSGGPGSTYGDAAIAADPQLLQLSLPVLGICYGMQWMAHVGGGQVAASAQREYGRATLQVDAQGVSHAAQFTDLFVRGSTQVWMSHGDAVTHLPAGFVQLARTDGCPHAAMVHMQRPLFGLQFHPEVSHTEGGTALLEGFLFDVAKLTPNWTMSTFLQVEHERIERQVGPNDKVVCALSGGVDSSVVAALLGRVLGDRLHCIFVDNGLLRHGERAQVEEVFGHALHLPLHVVDASDAFLAALHNVTDPEAKRRAIGHAFIDVFEAEATRIEGVRFLAQGTLYPDVIESFAGGNSAAIKSHHNVGGLPEHMRLSLLEPLRALFKDEVRRLGEELGLPRHLCYRQPFPGPGLAIRVLGEVTRARLATLRQADAIVQQELRQGGHADRLWQGFAVLLPVRSVGVMGDARTYEETMVLRAVESTDGMTADWARLPYEVLAAISRRVINEVRGINRVTYDISSKPPATIEWE